VVLPQPFSPIKPQPGPLAECAGSNCQWMAQENRNTDNSTGIELPQMGVSLELGGLSRLLLSWLASAS